MEIKRLENVIVVYTGTKDSAGNEYIATIITNYDDSTSIIYLYTDEYVECEASVTFGGCGFTGHIINILQLQNDELCDMFDELIEKILKEIDEL